MGHWGFCPPRTRRHEATTFQNPIGLACGPRSGQGQSAAKSAPRLLRRASHQDHIFDLTHHLKRLTAFNLCHSIVASIGRAHPLWLRDLERSPECMVDAETWYKALALGLGPTNPCSTDVHMEPFPTSAFKEVSLDYLLLPPRSAPVAAPGRLTPRPFSAHHCDPPTHRGFETSAGDARIAPAVEYRENA